MRVLQCIPGMGGGGAERQLAYLAHPLHERGWDVHVALVAGGPNLPRLESSGAHVHRLAVSSNYDPRLLSQLVRLVRTVRPDVVQVWFIQMEVAAGLACELLRVPWILSERSSAVGYTPTMKNALRRLMARTADAIVANSEAGADYWRERGTPRVPRFVVPNALPLGEIDRCPAGVPPGLSVTPGDSVVLFAGRFGPEKNVDGLVRALRDVVVTRPRTCAVLCGDGPLRAPLQQQIAADGLSGRILLPGYVEDIWPLMKRAEVVLSVGLYEGHPNTVMEAMAAGRPLVVSDIPAHRAILDERSARFVDPRDPVAIATAVAGLLNSPEAARQLAEAARGRALEWSLEAGAAGYDRIYRDVIARTDVRRSRRL